MIDKINLLMPTRSVDGQSATKIGNGGQDFASFFQNALRDVNKLQFEADTASKKLATGAVEDIAPVVIAAEKASLALQLTIQIRNKVIDAYNEVMRMQV
jgi:flagellar hook-basal body complex protein FliE